MDLAMPFCNNFNNALQRKADQRQRGFDPVDMGLPFGTHDGSHSRLREPSRLTKQRAL